MCGRQVPRILTQLLTEGDRQLRGVQNLARNARRPPEDRRVEGPPRTTTPLPPALAAAFLLLAHGYVLSPPHAARNVLGVRLIPGRADARLQLPSARPGAPAFSLLSKPHEPEPASRGARGGAGWITKLGNSRWMGILAVASPLVIAAIQRRSEPHLKHLKHFRLRCERRALFSPRSCSAEAGASGFLNRG
jgi:hypothetical protein